MTNNKITIAQAKQQITEGYSSIMTREDVLHLLDCLETTGTGKFEFDSEQIKDLSTNIADAIDQEGSSVIDDYELSMNYKEVELDSVEFNTAMLRNAIKDTIEEFIANLNEDEE